MHSALHVAVAHEAARVRIDNAGIQRGTGRRPARRARLFARMRAGAAPGLPPRAAPGMDA